MATLSGYSYLAYTQLEFGQFLDRGKAVYKRGFREIFLLTFEMVFAFGIKVRTGLVHHRWNYSLRTGRFSFQSKRADVRKSVASQLDIPTNWQRKQSLEVENFNQRVQ